MVLGAMIVEIMKLRAVETLPRITGHSHGFSDVTMCRTRNGDIM